ncbi:MAG TPA: hypothetical protein VKM72_30085 [Thermoanaerobaculia bacterium]|nr:hypothetical protein [Thermoanaerobaculia bacterium]
MRRRIFLLYGLPLLILLVWVALPLIRGTETLYLRDVLNTHFPMKQAQAEAWRHGWFPVIDPYRAGGQPLSGNPNAVPFYPTNLLYLAGSAFWALNAHFWVHLLLAPFAFFWMARSWGLAREPAWAAAVCYLVGGFYLSHLSFYNLIAAATLAPAFIAACLDFAAGRRRRWMAPLLALLWALLLLGGDPLMAALAGLLGGTALLATWGSGWRARRERPGWGAPLLFAAAVAAGTLLAWPQISEFLRILPLSFRGHWGYTREVATVASFDPRQLLEWLIPFAYGRPDLLDQGTFWGSKFYTDTPPYYLSLYPGLLAFALVAASGRPRSTAAWWAWGGILAGIFLSLGRFNPLAAWIFGGQGALRYPVKLWMPVAIGAALLCGIGFARLFSAEGGDLRARRSFRIALAVLFVILGGLWLWLGFTTGWSEAWLRGLIPEKFDAAFVANERLRWAGLCLLSLVFLGVLALLARIARRRPVGGAASLLAVFALGQLLLLRPLFPMDALVPYRVPPPALDHLPANLTVVNPDFNYLFGPSSLKQGTFPAQSSEWVERRAFYEAYPFTGPLWKRRYELNVSAEGLDSFLTRMAQGAVKGSRDNEQRIRLLAAWGVGRLVMNHPLTPKPERARLLAEIPSFGRVLYIYEIGDRAPEAFLARRVFPAPHLNAAYARLSSAAFDARTDAVLPAAKDGPPVQRGGGTARIVEKGPESLEVEAVAGPGGSLLVVQRSHGLYKAEVDGKEAEVLTANLHRLGVEVPAGRHHIRLWIDRRPLVRSFLVVAFGLALLPGLAWWGGRKE